MLDLKSWEPCEYAAGDHKITFEVRRLNRGEAQQHQAAMTQALRVQAETLKNSGIEGPDGSASIVRDVHLRAVMQSAVLAFHQAVGEEHTRQCFEKHTRNWQGIALDGVQLTDGAAVFAVADPALVTAVLTHIGHTAQLSSAEKNVLSSPSGSDLGAGIETVDSDSGATCTAPEVGAAP